MAILKIKDWIQNKQAQFSMIAPYTAMRILDGKVFFSTDHPSSEHSRIWFDYRKGNILEFMSDLIHVQIEVRKQNIKELPGMEFDPENYETLEVQINDIKKRNGIIFKQ